MKKNICFISIFDLTKVQYEMSVRLEARGHACYWITTSSIWTKFLLEKSVPNEKILELVFGEKNHLSNNERSAIIRDITNAELICSRTVNMALIADRFVMSGIETNLNDVVCFYFSSIKNFFLKKNIDVVFGEPTNTNEMISAMICEQIDIPFLFPQDLRLPNNRFFFEFGIATGQMVSSGAGNKRMHGKEFIDSFKINNRHPEYFHRINNSKSRSFFQSVKSRVIAIYAGQKNLTRYRVSDKLKEYFTRRLKIIYLDKIFCYDRLEEIQGEIAYFGLHVQPEASIDVLSPYFSDQLKLIKDMRRSLPMNVTLLVKEHPNFIGLKSIDFFKNIKRIPNVCIVRPETSNFQIYKKSKLVFTVSGTSAYEAAILGIPAVIFTKMFFGNFSSIRNCSNIGELKGIVDNILYGTNNNNDTDINVMDEILANSYPGLWIDPLSDDVVMKKDNLDSLSLGFMDVIETINVCKVNS